MIENMTYETPDRHGRTVPKELIGTKWRHANGFTYEIIGFVWNGSVDTWHVLHTRPDCEVQFSRPIAHFESGDENRFTSEDNIVLKALE